ncbi:cutinase-domain-containing protein [Tothia fuscella]|uniref:Cutinase n=1 Tax=Tothia fuscella TaxID=1048955 RepID=A0A9P4NHA4_9PEZI|nr:cutinase-domain-containing protein [Tothia fuscella]
MRVFVIAALFSAALASPQPQGKGKGSGGTGTVNPGGTPGNRGNPTENDLTSGPCSEVLFIMARASSEAGNMGGSMGPIVCRGLREAFPKRVGCQGVGGAYKAALGDNGLAKGTTDAAINEASTIFKTASTKCPNTILTFGGYSQGAAVMHNAITALPADIKKKLIAGVLFGDTRFKADRGLIKSYPKDQVMIFCAKENNPPDATCDGKPPNAGHFVYTTNGDGPKAIAFLKAKIEASLAAIKGPAMERAADTRWVVGKAV